jgi:hypothetical protein
MLLIAAVAKSRFVPPRHPAVAANGSGPKWPSAPLEGLIAAKSTLADLDDGQLWKLDFSLPLSAWSEWSCR